MSAWSLGAVPTSAAVAESIAIGADPPPLKSYVDKVVTWIPGDVLGLYVGGVSALGVAKPQVWLLIAAILLAPAVVVLGARTLPVNQRPGQIPRKAVLAAVATCIWTLSVPGSGWQAINAVASNAPTVAVIAAIAGLLFGLLAQALVTPPES